MELIWQIRSLPACFLPVNAETAPIGADPQELFVMGKKRIQRSQSKQQFVCFVGCPTASALFSAKPSSLRKEEVVATIFFFFFLPNNREHLNEPVCLLDDSFGQVLEEGQGAVGDCDDYEVLLFYEGYFLLSHSRILCVKETYMFIRKQRGKHPPLSIL